MGLRSPGAFFVVTGRDRQNSRGRISHVLLDSLLVESCIVSPRLGRQLRLDRGGDVAAKRGRCPQDVLEFQACGVGPHAMRSRVVDGFRNERSQKLRDHLVYSDLWLARSLLDNDRDRLEILVAEIAPATFAKLAHAVETALVEIFRHALAAHFVMAARGSFARREAPGVMKHRHLIDDVGFVVPAIDDILDRGSPEDWRELWAEVERDPWSRVAEDILRLCAAHEMYGTSNLWPRMIRLERDERGFG